MQRVDSLEKTLMLGGIAGRRRRGRQEDEMAGWHHWLNGRGSGWTPGVGDGQGGLACCDSWGRRVRLDWATELNWTEVSVMKTTKVIIIRPRHLKDMLNLCQRKGRTKTVTKKLHAMFKTYKRLNTGNNYIRPFCFLIFKFFLSWWKPSFLNNVL